MKRIRLSPQHRLRSLVILLLALLFVGAVATSLAVTLAAPGEFQLNLVWKDEGSKTFTYASAVDESRLVRMKVDYSSDATTRAYPAGGLQIAVQGLKAAVRSGESYLAEVAADPCTLR